MQQTLPPPPSPRERFVASARNAMQAPRVPASIVAQSSPTIMLVRNRTIVWQVGIVGCSVGPPSWARWAEARRRLRRGGAARGQRVPHPPRPRLNASPTLGAPCLASPWAGSDGGHERGLMCWHHWCPNRVGCSQYCPGRGLVYKDLERRSHGDEAGRRP